MARSVLNGDAGGVAYFKAICETAKLQPTPQGVWQIVYSAPKPNGGGWRSERLSTRTRDFAKAQAELVQFKTQALEQADACKIAHDPTIEELFAGYFDAKNLRPSDSLRYTAKGLCAVIGHMRPRDINDQVIADYMKTRRSVDGKALKHGSHRRALAAMKTAIRWGVRRKLVDASEVPVFDLPPDSVPRLEYMTLEEEKRFWDAAQARGGPIALFVAIGLETAARKNAICALTWDRVNFKTRVIDLQDPTKPVTRKRNAVVPITPRLMPVLKAAHAAAGSPVRGRLFQLKVRASFDRFAESLGLGWVTPHTMRHTWASLAASNGESLLQIAKMLGDTMKTVERTYAKVAPSDLMSMAERMAALKSRAPEFAQL